MPGRNLRRSLRAILRRAGQATVLAEEGGGAQQVFLLELLVGENDDEMVEPGLVDRLDGVVVRLLAQVDAADLRADVLGQRHDLEAGFGHHVHWRFSRRRRCSVDDSKIHSPPATGAVVAEAALELSSESAVTAIIEDDVWTLFCARLIAMIRNAHSNRHARSWHSLLALAAQPASAQEPFFKSKVINLYIGFARGGTYDYFGRMVAPLHRQAHSGQSDCRGADDAGRRQPAGRQFPLCAGAEGRHRAGRW